MIVDIQQRPLEIWECGLCGQRAELFIRPSGKPLCAHNHRGREMVRIWDREVGGEPPARGGEDADV